MKTIENKLNQKSATSLDRSLYEWVPRHELAQIVPRIVRATKTSDNATPSDEIALSILVYCYAIGVYRSNEIAERVRRNPARALSGAAFDGKAFAQCRRSNAALIKQSLASALNQAFQVQWTKNHSRNATQPRHLPVNANSASALNSEAERRLEVAEAWDLFDQEGVLGKSDRR